MTRPKFRHLRQGGVWRRASVVILSGLCAGATAQSFTQPPAQSPTTPLPVAAPPAGDALARSLTELSARRPEAVGTLERYLAALKTRPEAQAAEAGRRAAELSLQAAYDPLALQANGSYTHLDLDENLLAQGLGAAQVPGQNGSDGAGAANPGAMSSAPDSYKASATVLVRPYPFGDNADTVAQRQIDLDSSALSLKSTQTGLERRALEAALQFNLATRSLALAAAGSKAAAQGLEATQLRFDKGDANARELRDAKSALLEAQTLEQSAQLDVSTARQSIELLVGSATVPSLQALAALALPAPQTPLSVAQSELQLRAAEVGGSSAQRAIYPVATVGYAWNVDNHSTLSAGLESRTLQPSLTYSYQDPARTLPESALTGSLQLGISANISVGALQALEAIKAQQKAAQEALYAAQDGGDLQVKIFANSYQKARADARLKEEKLSNARLSYEENVKRYKLGLTSAIETQSALIEFLQADLEARGAALKELSSLLDIYEFYALPPSETL